MSVPTFHIHGQPVQYVALHWLAILVISAAVAAYWRRVRALRDSGVVVPLARQWAFGAGMAGVVIATLSPIDVLGQRYLVSLRAVQVLLLTYAAPLLLAGLRTPVIASTARAATERRWLRAILLEIGRPAQAWGIWMVSLCVWFVPGAFDFALRSSTGHLLELGTLLLGAVIGWWPLLDPERPQMRGSGWKAGYMALAQLGFGVLGLVLTNVSHEAYVRYASATPRIGVGAVADLHLAGAIFMFAGTIGVVAGVCTFLVKVGSDSEPLTIESLRAQGDPTVLAADADRTLS